MGRPYIPLVKTTPKQEVCRWQRECRTRISSQLHRFEALSHVVDIAGLRHKPRRQFPSLTESLFRALVRKLPRQGGEHHCFCEPADREAVREARAAREDGQRSWMSWYNEHRPHQALGYRARSNFVHNNITGWLDLEAALQLLNVRASCSGGCAPDLMKTTMSKGDFHV